MKTPVECRIDGKEYRIEQYLTTRGFLILKNLTALLGEPLVRLIAAIPKDAMKDGKFSVGAFLATEAPLEKFGAIFSNALSKLSDEDAEKLMKDILVQTFHGNTQVTEKFETHFQGDYGHLFRVIAKTLEVQYGDFLGAITGGVLKKAGAPKVMTA